MKKVMIDMSAADIASMRAKTYPHWSYLHRVINISLTKLASHKKINELYGAIDNALTAKDDTSFQGAIVNLSVHINKLREDYIHVVKEEQKNIPIEVLTESFYHQACELVGSEIVNDIIEQMYNEMVNEQNQISIWEITQ